MVKNKKIKNMENKDKIITREVIMFFALVIILFMFIMMIVGSVRGWF